MLSSKEVPLLLMITGACAVAFGLMSLPGIATNDLLSHELNAPEKAMVFDQNGGIKDSVWSWDSLVPSEQDGVYQPPTVDAGDLQANPFAEQ